MPDKPIISIFIDGNEVKVPAGTNIIEAAKAAGVEIPHYCYHRNLSVAGNCRMCLIEMGMEMKDRATGQVVLDESGKPKIQWLPRAQIACATNAAPGQHFKTNSPLVKDSRNAVLEFLLLNHPLDCPICDQAGECKLQEYAADYGRGVSRFTEEKNHKPKQTRLGPRVTLDDERCILCGRCVRFSREVARDDCLGFVNRGSYSTLSCYPGRELSHNYSLNTVDICPVGALTSTDFRFKMRVWFLKESPSICEESSVGINTTVGSREGRIYRVTPRRNDAVNDAWMTDSGRELYKAAQSPDRLGAGIDVEKTARAIQERLADGKGLAIVGSARMSLEEQFLLARIAGRLHPERLDLVAHLGASDGLLISEDRTPNMRGAFLTGLIGSYPADNLEGLRGQIAAGRIKTVLVIREDLGSLGLSLEDLKKVCVIAGDSHVTPTTLSAGLVQPLGTVFERSGSFINCQWRIQKFSQAVPMPKGVSSDIAFLDGILRNLGEKPLPAPTPEAVWKLMAESVPQLKGLSYAAIPPTGLVIDGSAWENISFPEITKTLHYEPKQAAHIA
jgi:NADH-quinone oxidoreductase subunit G